MSALRLSNSNLLEELGQLGRGAAEAVAGGAAVPEPAATASLCPGRRRRVQLQQLLERECGAADR